MAITVKEAPVQPKAKFQFVLSPRFELFYALQALTDEKSRIHSQWKQETRAQLPASFYEHYNTLGGSPQFWPAIADAFEYAAPDATFPQLITYLQNLDPADLQTAVLVGTLHYPDAIHELLDGTLSLKAFLEDAGEAERHWFSFLGLLPYREDALIVQGLNRLIQAPETIKHALLNVLTTFWDVSFETLWENVNPQLHRSLEEKRRLFDSLDLVEFTKQILLKMEVDENEQTFVCCKGHKKIPFNELINAYIMPSLFNDMRFWTYYEYSAGVKVFFPYFEPSISLDLDPLDPKPEKIAAKPNGKPVAPGLDPALIFKALGDNTRYNIVSLIAQAPRTAAQLAKTLGVSKPTISHHVQLLREAGLINEDHSSRSIALSLKREVIEHLSDLALGSLFKHP